MKPTSPPPTEDPIRPHVFDGIQEYDKRLPNWWLYTLYATIVFWVGYWAYYEWFRAGPSSEQAVVVAMAKIEAQRLTAAKVDDTSLWQMSQNAMLVDSGKAVYTANCIACHLASLRGKSESQVAIGPDLTDTTWVHGGKPTEVHDLITKGVLAKGMPTWGPVLGAKKIADVTAYILSRHREGEPIVVAADPVAK
ncbi:MAG: cbb3-type cytochrome c oxidase N-terminal domain-containing protein [Opitutaceae bacterium]